MGNTGDRLGFKHLYSAVQSIDLDFLRKGAENIAVIDCAACENGARNS